MLYARTCRFWLCQEVALELCLSTATDDRLRYVVGLRAALRRGLTSALKLTGAAAWLGLAGGGAVAQWRWRSCEQDFLAQRA